jgi:DNA-binding transcriptional ArsR family regulator
MLIDYLNAIPNQWKDNARIFMALGDEHRQRILLCFEKDERINIKQMVDISPLSRTSVNYHLRILKEAGLLQSEKVGKEVFYWVNKKILMDALQDVMDYLKEDL